MSTQLDRKSPKKRLYRDKNTAGLLDEIERLECCLLQGQELPTRDTPLGLLLRMSRVDRTSSTRILQIFCDPLRFRSWRDKIEPVEFLYMNPCGLEVIKSEGRWGVYVDTHELLLDLEATQPYEMARFEIRSTLVGEREVVWVM